MAVVPVRSPFTEETVTVTLLWLPLVVTLLRAKRICARLRCPTLTPQASAFEYDSVVSMIFFISSRVSIGSSYQSVSKTFTWRNKDGAQPWDIELVWPGSPLPSAVSPTLRQKRLSHEPA